MYPIDRWICWRELVEPNVPVPRGVRWMMRFAEENTGTKKAGDGWSGFHQDIQAL